MHSRVEQLISLMAQNVYFPFFCHPNPFCGNDKKGKELCDLLIVFDYSVVIISVKDCMYAPAKTRDNKIDIGWNRWVKKAINESVSQIEGAEKYILSKRPVASCIGGPIIPMPHKIKHIYRIAIAFGSQGAKSIPLDSTTKNNKYVHILNEACLQVLFKEFTTIPDFLRYLDHREDLLKTRLVKVQGEQNLIGWYLAGGCSFSKVKRLGRREMIAGPAFYEKYLASPQYVKIHNSYNYSRALDVALLEVIETAKRDGQDYIHQYAIPFGRLHRDERVSIAEAISDMRNEIPKDCYHSRTLHFDNNSKYVYLVMSGPVREPREVHREQLLKFADMAFLTAYGHRKQLPIEFCGLGVVKADYGPNTWIDFVRISFNEMNDIAEAEARYLDFKKTEVWSRMTEKDSQTFRTEANSSELNS